MKVLKLWHFLCQFVPDLQQALHPFPAEDHGFRPLSFTLFDTQLQTAPERAGDHHQTKPTEPHHTQDAETGF